MTTNTPTIKAFLDENESQFLSDQIEERIGSKVKMVHAKNSNEKWTITDPVANPILALPLGDLPFEMPDGWVKAAILKRYEPGFSILFNDKDDGTSMIRRLQQPLKVFFENDKVKDQCLAQFPRWTRTTSETNADAVITTTFNNKNDDPRPSFDFDPIELIPPPSSGIICLVTREKDKDSRRWCKQLMDRNTVMCSNLEREIVQLQQNQLPDATLFVFSRKTDSGFETAFALQHNDHWARSLETFSSTAGAAKMIWDNLAGQLKPM